MSAGISKRGDFLKSLRKIFTESLFANLAFLLILAVFLGYGLKFIDRTSFMLDGEKVYSLFDDAMISMQYAKNFANGNGLVWNAGGERVEGFSNPLWVLIMSVVHFFPIPLTQTSYFIKLLSLFFLLLNIILVLLLIKEFTKSKLIPLLAVFLTAFYYPLNNWALHGMEVGFMALLINAALWLSIRALRRKKFSPIAYVLLGLSILLRMDAAIIALTLTLGMVWIDPDNRNRHLQGGLTSIILPLFALTIFRLTYFGQWLPNTYYLKLGGMSLPLRISLGLKLFFDFVWAGNWLLFLIPLSLLILNRKKELLLLFSIILAQMLYSIFVGGDSWEHIGGANRYIASVMPLFFILFVLALEALQQMTIEKAPLQYQRARSISAVLMVLVTILSLVNFNTLSVNDYFKVWTLEKKPVFSSSVERYTRMGNSLAKVTTPDAVIAIVTAGTIPYFSERTSIDLLGKNDLVVARGQARINSSLFHPGNFRPGHNKWDYAYSLAANPPDVIAQFWQNTEEEIAPYLRDYVQITLEGISYHFRLDSPNVRWDLISTIQ